MPSVETPCLEGRTVAHLGKVRVRPRSAGSGHIPLRRCGGDVNRGWAWPELLAGRSQGPLTLPSARVFMWKMWGQEVAPNYDLEVVKSLFFSGWFLSFPPSQLHSFPSFFCVAQSLSLFLSRSNSLFYWKKKKSKKEKNCICSCAFSALLLSSPL